MRNEIRQAILQQQLKDGEMLPSVRKLMKTFGVSSGTIQSVLKQLSEEGHIYSIRGKGFFWGKAPNADDLAQLLSKTVHRETILERLEREFATDWEKGFLDPNKNLPLAKELSDRYNVSQTILRKFLIHKVNQGILVRRGRLYAFASPLKTKTVKNFSQILFVTRCNSWGGFTAESERELDFLRLVYQTAGEQHFKLILLGINEESGKLIDRSGKICRLTDYPNAIGAVLSTLLVQKPLPLLQLFYGVKYPVSVWWEQPLQDIPPRFLSKNNWAFFNSTFGEIPGQQMGKYLLQKGFKKVCYFSPYHNSSWSKDRLTGLQNSGIEVTAFTDDEFASPWDYKEIARAQAPRLSVEIYARNLVKKKLLKFAKDVPADCNCWVCVNDEVAGLFYEISDEGECNLPGEKTDPNVFGFDNSAESYLLRIASYDFNTSALIKQIFYYIENPDGFGNKKRLHQILGQVVEK